MQSSEKAEIWRILFLFPFHDMPCNITQLTKNKLTHCIVDTSVKTKV